MIAEAILFDMDGVIVDSMRSHADSWKQVLGEHGIELEDHEIFQREGMSGRQSIEEIFSEKQRPVPGEREFHDLLQKKHSIFERHAVDIFPLVDEILSWAGSKGIRSALVTGSLKRSVRHVLPRAVLSRFSAVITAEDVTRGKPDPEPYLRAMETLGVSAGQSLIIENSPMGIRSARAAGVTCFALETTLPRTYLSEADRVFSTHRELLDYLKSAIC